MSKDNPTGWVCIGRTGTFTDSKGVSHRITEADLDALQGGYDPARSEAALCFGHPKDSDPAFGWVHALKRGGKKLYAQFAQVPGEVKKLVDDGRYKYVSMSLSPDKKRLLHVGLLGASAPAIDGLGPVAFSETDGVTINFTASGAETEGNGGTMSTDELQKQIGALTEKLTAMQADNEALKAELAELKKDKDETDKEADATAAEFAAFKNKIVTDARQTRVRALVNAGKLEPAQEQETVSFAAALGEVKTPVNFSAANGTTEAISAEERYFRELESKPVDARFTNFSAHAARPQHAGTYRPAASPASITSKL